MYKINWWKTILLEDQALAAANSVRNKNLSNGPVSKEFEIEFAKPGIAINTATYWHALRSNNINDQLQVFGSLMSEQ